MENIFEEIMAEKFSNLIKSINLTDPRILTNLSSRNIKKTTPRNIKIKLIKIGGKEKNLKSKKKTYCVQGNKDKDYSKFLIRNSIS